MKMLCFIGRMLLLFVFFVSIFILFYLIEGQINVVEIAEMRFGYIVDFLLLNFGVCGTEYCLAVFFSVTAIVSILIFIDIPKLLW
ncbi:hypothetical protein ACFL3D_07040 [Candidatus Omnitrophota bacterium]